MIRGTTPTLEFTMPFDTSLIAELYITIKRVRQLGEMPGIGRRVYPHLIRHTTATDGLFRGMPAEEVQKLLGHVNITLINL